MRRIEDHISVEQLGDFFECDSAAGLLRWKPRPEHNYRVKIWNGRFAGEIAGRPNAKGYIQLSIIIGGIKWHTMVHRVIWAIVREQWASVSEELDHRDGDVGNNRLGNLRLCTPSDNSKNKGLYSNNKSGFKGVCWVDRYLKWGVQIQVDGHSKFGGYFDSAASAACAYDDLAIRNFGEFARTNAAMGLLG